MTRKSSISESQPKFRYALLVVLFAATVLQLFSSFLHHMWTPQDVQSIQEQASLSPHVVWDDGGIELMPMLRFINESAGIPGPNFHPNQPDALYLLERDDDDDDDEKKKKTNKTRFVMSMNTYWKHKVSFRRRQLTTGLNFLESSVRKLDGERFRWPRLTRAIEHPGGFPFLLNWDSTQNCTRACCDERYEMDPSQHIVTNGRVPVLRHVAPPTCQHRLFIPTALVLELAKTNPEEWHQQIQTFQNQTEYKRSNQSPKVVWRGTNPQVEAYVQSRTNLFEGKSKTQAQLCRGREELSHDFCDLSTLVLPYKEGDDSFSPAMFQQHAAVLDVDALQYPVLMCQNSVVLKASHNRSDTVDSFVKPLSTATKTDRVILY